MWTIWARGYCGHEPALPVLQFIRNVFRLSCSCFFFFVDGLHQAEAGCSAFGRGQSPAAVRRHAQPSTHAPFWTANKDFLTKPLRNPFSFFLLVPEAAQPSRSGIGAGCQASNSAATHPISGFDCAPTAASPRAILRRHACF
nr:hypothetical protein [Pandoravirus aubagnensis]